MIVLLPHCSHYRLRKNVEKQNTDHTTHNENHPLHTPHRSHQAHLYQMNQHSYETSVEGKHGQAQIALVILIDSHNESEAKQMMRAFLKVTSQYRDHRLTLWYLCYRTHEDWLETMLEQCIGMKYDKIGMRVSDCLSGNVATVVALLGSKKQLCVFPETEPTNNCNGNSNFDDTHLNTHVKTPSVGDTLGSVLDFDDEDSNSNRRAQENGGVTQQNGSTRGDGVCSRAEQIRTNFETWMEKFADGTLKRYKVTTWPSWT